MFVRLNNIMTLIEKSNYGNRTIIGECHFNSSPFRDKRSKYYVSFDMFPRKHYPPFCLGTGYLMTRAAVKAVLAHGATTPLTRLEDTSIGILSGKAGNVKFVNFPRWRSERFTNSCPKHYTQHSLTAKQIQQAVEYVCEREISTRESMFSDILGCTRFAEIVWGVRKLSV